MKFCCNKIDVNNLIDNGYKINWYKIGVFFSRTESSQNSKDSNEKLPSQLVIFMYAIIGWAEHCVTEDKRLVIITELTSKTSKV